MKKKLLICSLSVMLLVVGVLVAQGETQKQTEGQGSTENLLNNANEISKVTEVVLTEEIDNNSAYPSGDLLYREFSQGCELEKGTEVFIEKEQVANVLDKALAIGIVLNGEVYKEIPFEDADIQLKLEKSGNDDIFGSDLESNIAAVRKIVERLQNPLSAVSERNAKFAENEKSFYTALLNNLA